MSVLVNDDGFNFRGSVVPWPTVLAIATYKRDLFASDDICLAFKVGHDSWIEVSEEEPGFESLVAEVECRYPEIPRDWFSKAMHPAFATNYRVLWGVA